MDARRSAVVHRLAAAAVVPVDGRAVDAVPVCSPVDAAAPADATEGLVPVPAELAELLHDDRTATRSKTGPAAHPCRTTPDS
ncbi:hypothetical protein [Frankia gtarii]|uniref:hypothetical protein n=1 Tax=Frankia gtarii TaxID=2950102 RepID=UPI0021BDF830|nr:hypothetical protein [Frankia gtarii]